MQGSLPVDVSDNGGGLLSRAHSLALQRLTGPGLTHGRDVPHVLGLVACKSVRASKLYLDLPNQLLVRVDNTAASPH